ncbi:HypC/HybG/HupF family hydrogenase formation chaperone [Methylomonas methanica]|uniref:Hydrogenase assembly chaperone hypC/hupF n=1 Tax=Methylomonas methanica (strain DSM 25384 / MC09) TaxID=857087 RepID=G0A2L2_METMM|nr:HypC/HybG/HupF family hydrogenase formation chaperone [Methylomonas methanica]AEG00192.1 hydrogenase assembly chaperone hypC/hupF [Methylomonas methanica MC09]
MCIGIPMQVLETRGESALCVYRGETSVIDMMLVGEQPMGAWLLVFLNTAREVISADKARQINDALEAMRLAMQGDTDIDHLFADLVDREPELPEHLRS